MTTGHQPQRRKRADGELSRERILDATTEIAAERGYEGTSIALVSAKFDLPASSFYWHFKSKDDPIAAVIERSFGTWLNACQVPPDGTTRDRAVTVVVQVAKALLDPRLHPIEPDAVAAAPTRPAPGPGRCSWRPAPTGSPSSPGPSSTPPGRIIDKQVE